MKLYYSPGACSQAVHIALREAGTRFELERVDLKTKKTEHDTDFKTVNPKGYVPVLQLDDGQLLTETAAILQYVADLRPETGLAPPAGRLERYRLVEWLGFIATELHKQFGPLFKGAPDEVKDKQRELIVERLGFVDNSLADKSYLLGETFTVADAYLFVMTRWAKKFGLDVDRFSKLSAWSKRVAARPSVFQVSRAEGLKDVASAA